ncbi:hypothetical protein I3843_05G171000 [Carya illinoinensis]|uniref:Uncharacterized protein n=1 Tax=Carya illinoinensis TaxID=32201 RepID=A0A922F4V3_CARIL|nr:hypothetical protein I3842_05G187600 [Carya illinoinensis]KAG7980228.1 hypothetical protein I3843_05G171000 [Carya illinoinensis]
MNCFILFSPSVVSLSFSPLFFTLLSFPLRVFLKNEKLSLWICRFLKIGERRSLEIHQVAEEIEIEIGKKTIIILVVPTLLATKGEEVNTLILHKSAPKKFQEKFQYTVSEELPEHPSSFPNPETFVTSYPFQFFFFLRMFHLLLI